MGNEEEENARGEEEIEGRVERGEEKGGGGGGGGGGEEEEKEWER